MDELLLAFEEYEAWLNDHCEHGAPPGAYCGDCEEEPYNPWR